MTEKKKRRSTFKKGRPRSACAVMPKIRVFIKEADGSMRLGKVENSIDKMEEAVGGQLEVLPVFKDIMLIVNKGRNPRLERLNLSSVQGTAVICGSNGDDFKSIRRLQIESMEPIFKDWGWTV